MPSTSMCRVLGIVIFLLVPVVHAVEKGSEQVSPFYGSFSYAVPIEVPPFRGLEPRLALSHTSEGRNGFVGVGWGLAGFGTVERTNAGGGTPRWDTTDVFWLDGQKLLPCQWGMTTPSCTTGGTHATETESFRRVRFDAPTNTWAVWDPSGIRSVYSALMTATGGTYRWGLSAVIDTKSNTVSYQWQCNTDCYPSSVTYGPYAIGFFREARPDVISYGRGTDPLGRTTERLLSVIVYAPGVGHIRGYKLSYAVSDTTGRSLLTSVQQYGKDLTHNNGVFTSGSTLPAQVFTYTQDAIAKSFVSETPAPPTPPGTTEPVSWAERKNTTPTGTGNSLARTGGTAGQWDALGSSTSALASGDGYLEVTAGPEGGKIYGLSRKTRDFLPEEIDYAFAEVAGGTHVVHVLDKGIDRGTFPAPEGSLLRIEVSNGAVLYKVNGTTVYTRSAGNKIGYPLVAAASMSVGGAVVRNAVLSGALQASASWCWGETLLTADFNGDGKTDQACYTTLNQTTRVSLSTGSGFAAPTVWLTGANLAKVVTGDFNNDGKADLAVFNQYASEFWVSLSNGSSFGTPVNWGHAAGTMPNGFPANCETPYVALGAGDFNGDGRLDVSCRPAQWASPAPSPIIIGVSNGTSFSFSVWGDLGCDFPANQSTGSIDFDADGKDDWYCIGGDGFQVYVSSGTSFVAPAFGTLDQTFCGSRYVLGDFNGDGRVDAHCADNGKVALSTGRSFAVQGSYGGWCPVLPGEETPTTQVFGADVDGDGTSELVCNNGVGSANDIQVRRWSDSGLAAAETWKTGWCEGQLRGGDFNGDAKTDLLCDNLGTPVAFAGTSGKTVDLLASARNSLGGLTSAAYTPTSSFTSINNPPTRYAVTALTLNDGRSGPVTRTHSYSGGYMDRMARKFLGFQYARTTKPCLAGENPCPYEEIWFQQDPIAGSRLQRSESHTGGGQLLAKSVLEYTATAASTPYTLMQTGAWSYAYGSSGGSKRSYTTTSYDAYGNATQVTEYGDYDAAGDERTTVVSFSPNPGAFIVNRASSTEIHAGAGTSGQVQSRMLFGYDGAAAGVPPTEGYVTLTSSWVDATSSYENATVEYDAWGNIKTLTDASMAITRFTMDPTNGLFLQQLEDPVGRLSALQWDTICTEPSVFTDENQQTSTTQYDAFCRPSRTDGALGTFETTSRLDFGNPVLQRTRVETPSASVGDGSGNYYTQAYYDGFGRAYRTESKGPSSSQTIVTETAYNARGGRAWSKQPYYAGAPTSPTTSYSYDALDRLTRTLLPDNHEIRVAYGAWQTTTTDPSGHAVTRFVDGFGRLRRSEELDDNARLVATEFSYNTRGEIVGMTDPANNAWSWNYDSLGRLLSRSDPDAGYWTYAHNVALRQVTQTDAKGQITETRTDGAGRLSQRRTYGPDGSTVTFTYGEARPGYFNAGRLTTMTDAHGSERYDYDALGRQVRRVRSLDAVDYTLLRRFTTSGHVAGTTFPDGDAFGTPSNPITYDAAGRLKSVPAIVTDVQYDALGRPTQRTNANGTATSWQYHDRGWLRHITTQGTSGLVQDLDYAADEVGRTTSLTSTFPNEGWQYGYDALGRLTTATNLWDPAESQAFEYDLVGNKTYDSRIGTLGYPLPGSVRPHAPTSVAGQALQYDLNGNLVSGRGRTCGWNPDNQPTAINGVTFLYGGDGSRLKKATAQSTTLYPLGDDYEIRDGVVTKYFRWGAPVAERVGSATHWLHTDRLGSVQAVTDASGQDILRRTYRPYGHQIGNSGAHWEPLGFIGQREDPETGLTYLHARYYDSELGLFLSPDPLSPVTAGVGPNRYAYSGGDPINRSDPSGLTVGGDNSGQLHVVFQRYGECDISAQCDGSLGSLTTQMSDHQWKPGEVVGGSLLFGLIDWLVGGSGDGTPGTGPSGPGGDPGPGPGNPGPGNPGPGNPGPGNPGPGNPGPGGSGPGGSGPGGSGPAPGGTGSAPGAAGAPSSPPSGNGGASNGSTGNGRGFSAPRDGGGCRSDGAWGTAACYSRCVDRFLFSPTLYLFGTLGAGWAYAYAHAPSGAGRMTNAEYFGATVSTTAAIRMGLIKVIPQDLLLFSRAGAAAGSSFASFVTGAVAVGGAGVVLGCGTACAINQCTY